MESTGKKSENSSVEKNLSANYVSKSTTPMPLNPQTNTLQKREQEKIQKNIDSLKAQITKKFKFIEAIGIIPANSIKKIEEEYEISSADAKRGLHHILVIIPEKHFKKITQIRLEIVEAARKIDEKFWMHVMTPVDIWNLGLDSKFEVMESLAMSYPILDKGILSAMRVSQIHKSLVLRKFEKYVTSYVVAGSLPRGEATKISDVDVFIIIDDTDVKRMSRLELKEKLRSIIQSYIQEAQAMAGVKNILNVQTFLMTEFWDSVKDAHPVMFTFIRDGVPLYDRGAFLPWKSLLRMGKIKPSPEAIDMFMSSGNKLEEVVNRRILDIAVHDLYWGVLTPSQGILMLFGLAPSTPKETLKLIREVFFAKEKLLEEKYVKILESIVGFYKDFEHGKNRKLSGTNLDKMFRDALSYMKRLREIREQIEKRVAEKSIKQTYEELFDMLRSLLEKKSEAAIIKEFEKRYILEGKLPKRLLENLKFIAKVKKDSQTPKKQTKKKVVSGIKSRKVDEARKFASEITKVLIEYSQRCDFLSMEKSRYIINGRDATAEVFFLENTYLVDGPKVQKVTNGKIIASDSEELKRELVSNQGKEIKIDLGALEGLKKVFGKFDLVQ